MKTQRANRQPVANQLLALIEELRADGFSNRETVGQAIEFSNQSLKRIDDKLLRASVMVLRNTIADRIEYIMKQQWS